MTIKPIPLNLLLVNKANDRHGELENETAAIAWLFNNREQHMRNLAKDIASKKQIFELPLVSPKGPKFTVFDGNRRVTCMKLLSDPRRAPSVELQTFFGELRKAWTDPFPSTIQCQIEGDRDRIDEILFRRHTGVQDGVGQSMWDDRMKAIFVDRTGKGGGINVADEIEKRLKAASLLPGRRKVPRSTMNRLLSAETFRNRVGFSARRGKFEFTHDEKVALGAMARIASDLAHRRLVLGDIWDVDGKRSYLDQLEHEGVLPTAADIRATSIDHAPTRNAQPMRAQKPAKQTARETLIPQKDFCIVWPGRLQRHHEIWEELQFNLRLSEHRNAIAVLFRVLLELAVENYITQNAVAVHDNDKLATRALKAGKDMQAKGRIDQKQLGVVTKFQQQDQLISADTLNRYVHSSDFSPSPHHLTSLWDSLAGFVVQCLIV